MEPTVTTLPPMKYYPYTEVEYIELKSIMSQITTHIPTDRMGWVWGNHNRIMKSNEPQPCSCGSAAGHWRRAAETIRNFIENIEKND
jgi:hypothetical protein